MQAGGRAHLAEGGGLVARAVEDLRDEVVLEVDPARHARRPANTPPQSESAVQTTTRSEGVAHGLRFIWVCCPMCEGWRPVMNVERLGEQKR